MAHLYEFGAAAAHDLNQLSRHNSDVLVAIMVTHLPKILADPLAAGEKKKGNLAHVRGYGFTMHQVAYRLVYTVQDDVVTVVAIGPHDEAYAKASRRK